MGFLTICLTIQTLQVGFPGKQTLRWKLAGCLLGSELYTWAEGTPQSLSCPHGLAFQVVPTGTRRLACTSVLIRLWVGDALGKGQGPQIRPALEGTLWDASQVQQHSGVCVVC